MPVNRRFAFTVGLCIVLSALVLWFIPAEKTIGQVIKIVYLHGALSRAGMIGFLAGGLAGLGYLLRSRPALVTWSNALAASGWAFWTAHFVVSIPATRLTWGPWVAWGEPRVTMTLQIVSVGLVILTIGWLLRSPRFSAGANALLAGTVLFLAVRTGVFRHPLDPIGSSPSVLLRVTYLALLIPVIAAMVASAWRLTLVPALQSHFLTQHSMPMRTEA